MSAYSDGVLALNPVRYARCDELVAGVLNDSSTFAEHGTTEPLAVFGLPSAIETDAGSSSIGGPVGTLPAAAGSEADLLENFTWIFWAFYDAAFPSGTAICRRGQFGLTNSVQAGINEDNIFVDVTLENAGSGDAFQLVATANLVDQTWYMVAVVRNDTNLRLYVNADLSQGNERSDLTGALVDVAPGTSWFIGRSVNTTAFSATRTDEVALFDYALSAGQIQALYELALNSLDLFGVSNVIPTAVLYSDIEPDPVGFPFRHNWERPLVERISFLTGISQTRSGAEEGVGARTRPRREIEWSQIIRDNDERQSLRAKLKAQQNRKWFIPILEHREQLSGSVSSGATSIPANTEYKDYQNGGYVHLRELNATGQIVKSEDLQIQSFTGSAITTRTPTVNSYAAILAQVCPARRGIISASVSAQGHTAEVEEINLTARLMAEDEPATPNRIIPWEPTIIYRDHEVHDPLVWQSNDWSELRDYEIERAADYIDFDTGIFDVESDTDGAAEAFSYRVKLKSIERIAEFLGWFYARAGSLVYLWVPSMQRDLTFVSAALADMTVSGHIYTENFAGTQSRRDLAFVYNDNTMIFRRINSATTSGSNDVLTLNTSPPTQTNLRSISYLKFCRLDADSLEKALVTDDVMMATWRFRELLHSPD